MFRKGVVGIIFNKSNEFLLLRRKLGWKGWEFPKGGVENESEEDALLREIKEETGLERVNIVRKLPHIIKYSYPARLMSQYEGSEQSVYLLKLLAEDRVTLSEEHDDFKWCSFAEAMELIRWKDQKDVLEMAKQYV